MLDHSETRHLEYYSKKYSSEQGEEVGGLNRIINRQEKKVEKFGLQSYSELTETSMYPIHEMMWISLSLLLTYLKIADPWLIPEKHKWAIWFRLLERMKVEQNLDWYIRRLVNVFRICLFFTDSSFLKSRSTSLRTTQMHHLCLVSLFFFAHRKLCILNSFWGFFSQWYM